MYFCIKFVIFNAFLLISTAVARQLGLFIIEIIKQPEPVPISNMCLEELI